MNQNETVIILRSLTHAIKAKKRLQEYGIEARVVKPDAHKTEKGCGYGVSTSKSEAERAEKILRESGIYPLEL